MGRQRSHFSPSRNGDGRRPMFYNGPDPITLSKMEGILRNASQIRNASWPFSGLPTSMQRGRSETAELDPRRNFAHDCGWPAFVSVEDYKELIDREPIAAIVNGVYARESYQMEPIIEEESDANTTTDFEDTLRNLHKTMQREPSYYEGDNSNQVLQILQTFDELAGYGRYGALLIGLNDGKDLAEPVDVLSPPVGGMQCLFMQPFPEHMARVTMFDMDWMSSRYGLPTKYLVTFADPQDMSSTGVNENFSARQVHWSRIVHLRDGWHHPTSSRIFAIERCRPCLNPILDIRKIRGASAEGYYQACFNALHFGTHPQLGPDVEMDRDSILDMYEQFANGLQRILVTTGGTVDPIAPTLPDPTHAMLIQIQCICMKLRMPFRLLIGSEIGQLASGDDKVKWIKQLMGRQIGFNTPYVLVPVIDRLINLGVVKRPKKGYRIKWPKIDMQTAAERMDALLKRTQAYGFYATQNVEAMIPPFEYMTKFDSMSVEEANQVIAAQAVHVEALQSGDLSLLDEVPTPIDVLRPPETPEGATGSSDFSDGNNPGMATVAKQ